MKRQLHPNPLPERHGHTRPAMAGRVWRQLSGDYDLRTPWQIRMSGGISAKCHVASLGLRDAGIQELLPALSCASANVRCKTVRVPPSRKRASG
jgi:hypothetical protein